MVCFLFKSSLRETKAGLCWHTWYWRGRVKKQQQFICNCFTHWENSLKVNLTYFLTTREMLLGKHKWSRSFGPRYTSPVRIVRKKENSPYWRVSEVQRLWNTWLSVGSMTDQWAKPPRCFRVSILILSLDYCACSPHVLMGFPQIRSVTLPVLPPIFIEWGE